MIKKTYLNILVLLLTFFLGSVSYAKIYIVLDDPSGKKLPIAIPLVKDSHGSTSDLTNSITSLIKQDIALAGYFQTIDEKGFLKPDSDPIDQVSFEKWQSIEAHALIKGSVARSGSKTVLDLRLYDVQTKELLVGKQYTFKDKDYPEAIHRFMDSLMEALTGKKGPFLTHVVTACGKPNARQIYTLAIDGTERQQVTAIKANNISPSWSPDGQSIVFTSFKSRYPEIYTISANGGTLQQVTHNTATNITPVFTPDGSGIVFSSSQNGDTELYLATREGRILSRLTQSLNIDLSPTFSPDGSRLIFSSERAGNLHLFSMPAGGGAATRLTYTGYQNDQPDWSPDGQKVVFTSRDRGAFDVFVMNADGSLIQRITRDEGNNESPTWSPDGRYIVFSSARGTPGLYIMMADGNNQTHIADTAACINPEWGPWLQ